MKTLLNNRIFILFLVILLVHLLLKNLLKINMYNIFLKKKTYEGFKSRDELPCIEYPKNIDNPVEIGRNVEKIVKYLEYTLTDLDNIVTKAIKDNHSDELFKTNINKYFLTIEEKCKTIKLDGDSYTYKEISEGKNFKKAEKKLLDDETKIRELRDKYEEKITNKERKNINVNKKKMMENYSKIFKKITEYRKKKDHYLTEKKTAIVGEKINEIGLPVLILLDAFGKRIKCKKGFKKDRVRYVINFDLKVSESIAKLSDELLNSSVLKEMSK